MRLLKTVLISLVLAMFIVAGCVYVRNIKTYMTHAFSDLALEKMQSVVYIMIGTAEMTGGGGKMGSGIVISADGYVITNNHVVAGEEEVGIITYDGEEYKAKVVGSDPKTDIALLKIESKDSFVPFEIGNSDEIEIGEWVMTIGGPFGLLNSISIGIISGKNRAMGNGPYDSFIQTDASINPGNSGGPLINLNGEVIGVNSMILTRDRQIRNIGVGLAIPINMAMVIVKQLKKNGKIIRARFGIIIREINSELKEKYKLVSKKGVIVEDISANGPAEKAGLKKGDVIISFNGKEFSHAQKLSFEVAMSPIGEEIEIVVIRDGEEKIIKVILETMDPSAALSVPDMEQKFGFTTEPMTPELAESLSKMNNMSIKKGIVIVAVELKSPAYKAGLYRNDIILTIDAEEIKSPKDYSVIMLKLSARKMLSMKVLRKGIEKVVVLKRD